MGIEVMKAPVELLLSTFRTATIPSEVIGTYALLPRIAVEPEPTPVALTTETPSGLDVEAPGGGLLTLTATEEFACEDVAVPEAVTCVEETKLVPNCTPPKLTTAPGTKFDPFK